MAWWGQEMRGISGPSLTTPASWWNWQPSRRPCLSLLSTWVPGQFRAVPELKEVGSTEAVVSHPFLLPTAILWEIASIRCAVHTAGVYTAADCGASTGRLCCAAPGPAAESWGPGCSHHSLWRKVGPWSPFMTDLAPQEILES